jgi:hypothetical protein
VSVAAAATRWAASSSARRACSSTPARSITFSCSTRRTERSPSRAG